MTATEMWEYCRGVFQQASSLSQQPAVPFEPRVRLSEINALMSQALAGTVLPPVPFTPKEDAK